MKTANIKIQTEMTQDQKEQATEILGRAMVELIHFCDVSGVQNPLIKAEVTEKETGNKYVIVFERTDLDNSKEQ